MVTAIVAVVLLLYGIKRFQKLALREQPDVSENLIGGYNDNSFVINFNKTGFKIAFAIENYVDRSGKDDPSYVMWIAQLNAKGSDSKLKGVKTMLTFHKCTKDDFAQFYPSASG